MRIGIIRTRWNNEDVSNLVSGVREGLAKCKVNEKSIFETSVPGSFELPLAARYLALSGTVDAIVCVGVECIRLRSFLCFKGRIMSCADASLFSLSSQFFFPLPQNRLRPTLAHPCCH